MFELNWKVDELTPNQKVIADFIEKSKQSVLFMTETDIAEQLGISNATVSRFWRSIGYHNFKEFKQTLKENTEISPANKLENLLRQVDSNQLPQKMLSLSSRHLEETLFHLSTEMMQAAIDALLKASNIHIYSPGPSEGLGQLLSFRLARFGLSIRRIEKSGHELFESIVHLNKQDTVILFGFVQPHPETRVILDHAKEIGCTSIVITDRLISDFNTCADIVLYASRGELWEFHSMIAPTFLIENLIIGVGMEQKEKSLSKLDEIKSLRTKYKECLPR